MDWSVFLALFHYSGLLPLVQLPNGILNLTFLEDNAELASWLSVNYCYSETGFNQGTQFLETCKFCVQTHLWWRCSPPGLIPHGAIYNSPVDS